MQTATVAMDIVREFVSRAEPAFLPSVDAAWSLARTASSSAPASQVQEAAAAVRAVWWHLDENRSAYSGFSNTDVEWAIQNGKIVEQAVYVKIGGTNYRDISMAANMEWILKQNPGARAVVWAHNGHVCRLPGWMGSYLDQTFGEDYRVFGFLFHEGQYNALNRYPGGSLTTNVATPSFPGSVEYAFHSTGIPQFWTCGTRRPRTPPRDGCSARFSIVMSARSPMTGFASTNRLAADFDALIYFERTTPSVLLPF
jgi:erythromycin esterase-like protein